MKLTITALACGHVHIKDAVSGALLYAMTVPELRQEARDGDPLLMQMRYVVKAAGATTKQQAKTAIEAAEFV